MLSTTFCNATRPPLPCLSHQIFSFQTTTTHLRSRPQCSLTYPPLLSAPLLPYLTALPPSLPIQALPLLVFLASFVFPSPPRPRISLRPPLPFLARAWMKAVWILISHQRLRPPKFQSHVSFCARLSLPLLVSLRLIYRAPHPALWAPLRGGIEMLPHLIVP